MKLIKWGMDTKEVVARFESERQALALMNHPSIASVYDAGASEQGRPYFAMEFVRGEPITTYCDRHRLPVGERLEFFTQVCEGVQHAHQKGIIHRDIKPSNILVTIRDDKPVPKIIDFGVAKAISQRLTERTVYTELGELIGTPEYMSPEQAEMSGLDIDTRSDVYSLGVVLYELLVGTQPLDSTKRVGFDEMRKRIREEEPSRPSTRLRSLGDSSTVAAWDRRMEIPTLERLLRGDLDWITMKALEKDRTRRYSSPSELAADLGRHLRHEPVVAGPPSTWYRTGKFIRRHRLGVAVGLALVGVLATVAVLMTVQAARIARERDRAEQEAVKAKAVNAFMQETLGSANPYEGVGREVTVLEVLKEAEKKIDDAFASQREIQAAVQSTIGMTYRQLGHYEEAEPLLRSALEIRKSVLGPTHPDVAESLIEMANLLQDEGDYEGAEPLYREALAMGHKFSEDTATATRLNNLAILLKDQGDYKGAEPLYREALAMDRKLLGAEHPSVADKLNNLANLLSDKGDYEAAEPLYREALAIHRRALGEEHPGVSHRPEQPGGLTCG